MKSSFIPLCLTLLMSVNVLAKNDHLSAKIKSAGELINVKNIKIESNILGESREIYVSLPPRYNQNVNDYPVIFVLDAEFMFDITRSMTTLWAARNYMPESIVIGLPNPTHKDRFELSQKVKGKSGRYAYNGGGNPEKYLNFFNEELFPLLQKKYRINSNRTIIGLSPTAGTVYQAFLDEPKQFNHFIAMNSGIQKTFDSGQTIAERLIESVKHHKNSTLYMGRGEVSKERKAIQQQFTKDFNKESSSNVRLKFDNLEGEFGYAIVVNSLSSAFRFIYPRDIYNVDYTAFLKAKDPTKTIELFYANLSARYGYNIYPVEITDYNYYNLFHMMRRLISSNQIKDAKKLVQLALSYYPNSSNFYYRLAQVNQAENDIKSATRHLKKSIRLAEKHNNENLGMFKAELDALLN